MEMPEQTFTLRFSLQAEFPDSLLDDDEFEIDEWLREWETLIKPELIRKVFAHLRSFPSWKAHIRNRGIAPTEEVEIVFTKTSPQDQ